MILERTITSALAARVQASPHEPFVKCGADWVTSAELSARADHVAGALSGLGVAPGDHIALVIPNRMEMVEVFFGCARLGVTQIPLNAWLKGEFLRYQLTDSQATVLIADDAGLRAALELLPASSVRHVIALDDIDANLFPGIEVHSYRELVAQRLTAPTVEIAPSDIASIIYTSGTTGLPKGCMLSNGYYMSGPGVLVERGWVEAGDRIFTAWPLFHTSGQVVAFMTPLLAGGSVVFEAEFSASSFLDRARADDATVLCGVGFMGAALLAQPPRPEDTQHRFRLATWIPMAPTQQLEFEARFQTPVIAEAFGQTECFPITMAAMTDKRKRTSIGTQHPLFEVRLVDAHDNPVGPGDVGEITVRPQAANAMFSGYWNKPEASVAAWQNLWHHTGDLARADDQGTLSFVDRKKDAIRRRGENISSIELEAAISKLAVVAQVSVCAVTAAVGEDDVKACIILRPDSTLDPNEAFAFFRDHLPYYAIPRYVQVRESLPTNALGRVMKQVLRDEGAGEGTWDLEALSLRVERQDRR